MQKALRQFRGLLRLAAARASRSAVPGIYLGMTGLVNLGDALMYPLIRDMLRPAALFDFCPRANSGLRNLLTRAFGFCCLGGGTLINGTVFREALRLIQDEGLPCFSFGAGVKDPEYWTGIAAYDQDHAEWTAVLNRFEILGVRGPLSADILQKQGVTRPVHVVGDPCLLRTPEQNSIRPRSRILGVNFGRAIGPVFGSAEEAAMRKLATAMRELERNGWRFRFFTVRPQDESVCRYLAGSVRGARAQLYPEYADARGYVRAVSQCDVFVGYKLHAVALAMAAGVHAIMLSYRPKCDDLMASLNCRDWSVRLPDVRAAQLAGSVEQLYERCEEFSGEVHQACLRYKRELRDFAGLVVEAVTMRARSSRGRGGTAFHHP